MYRFMWLILLILLAVGCSGRERGVRVEQPPPQVLVKAILTETAEAGKVTSGEALQMYLEAMRESDPAKADALLADYRVLMTLSNPAEIKSKALKMAGEL